MSEKDKLSERQKSILALVIQEYVGQASPVSSRAITAYDLGVSSATIRNEMVVLEDAGYLAQPHTSAGRTPTELGYRYFVENLMKGAALPTDEQMMINHQFHQARLELDQWLKLSAAVLAHSSHNASLVTAPKSGHCRVKHVEVISIQDTVALLILVLQGGTLKQQILTLDEPIEQDVLSATGRHLTELWSGLDVSGVIQASYGLTDLSAKVAGIVREIMRRVDGRRSSDIYRDGLLNVLAQPEFQDQKDTLQQVIRALEERWLIEQLIAEVLEEGGIQIIIGGEGRWDELSNVSIVLARYGVDDEINGVVGVLGPTRMPYARSVSVVRYMSRLMSDLIGNLYG